MNKLPVPLNVEAASVQRVFGLEDEAIFDLQHFHLEERLGGGSTSEVFHAVTPEGRNVAIKQYRFGIGGAKDYDHIRTAFKREVKLFRDLEGVEHIPQFYGIGAERIGRGNFITYNPALIMEYVSGKSLADRMAPGFLQLTYALVVHNGIIYPYFTK